LNRAWSTARRRRNLSAIASGINFIFGLLWISQGCAMMESVCNQSHFSGKEANPMFKMQKKGQGLVEYALILVLVAIVIIIILSVLGPAIGNVFSQIVNTI
jgi:pilus assembly protein Flp/PilA